MTAPAGRSLRRRFLGAAIAALALVHRVAAAPVVGPLGRGTLAGWCALDLDTGLRSGYEPDIRLPMCSSVKWLLAAAVLARVDRGAERLDRLVPFGPGDLVYNSPSVEAALRTGDGRKGMLTIGALCEAAVTRSDSAAANLLFPVVGGPAGLTTWLRVQGDAVTRSDRTELALNRVPPGDLRDTTSPAAMVGDLHRLLYGPGLGEASKTLLLDWLLAARPGAARMPAGLREGWRIGHKTGTWRVDHGHPASERSASVDVAVLLPPRGAPLLIAACTAGSEQPQDVVDRWFADVVANAIDARERRD